MTVSPRCSRARALSAVLVLAATLGWAHPVQAQGGDRYRFGLAFGGTSSVGLTFEYQFENVALEATVGTLGFRDVSLSLVAKHYAGGGELHPYVGGGLWSVAAFPPEEEKRTGWILVFRAPVGLDWAVADAHSFGLEANINRALAVRRTDPEDTRGPQSRLVPLPAFYYRWASEQPPGR